MSLNFFSKEDYNKEKQKHLSLLNSSFITEGGKKFFSPKELLLLKKYGAWLQAIYHQEVKAITKKQLDFFICMHTNTPPVDEVANLFFRYIGRINIEKNNSQKLKLNYVWDNNEFYSREQYHHLHSQYALS